ncbi:MAG: Crp/Fnr family transcriptional regulator [Magnetococcus sp. WYHC-3]
MRGSMRVVHLAEGETLFLEQDPAHRFFFLHLGQIKLFRLAPGGQEKVIGIVKPGETFATPVMFMEAPNYPVSAEATQTSRVLSFSNSDFLDLLRASTETCFRLMADMSRRMRCQVVEIDGLSLRSASARLVRFLLDELEEDGQTVVLQAPKRLIALRLSIQPETFSRLLGRLRRQGLIEVDNRTIRVLDAAALEAFADEDES